MASIALLRNNVAFGNGVDLINSTEQDVDDQHNSWNMQVPPAAEDFVSPIPAGIDGPREWDGSLPSTSFLHLSSNSPLIDTGIDVGWPFAGEAPDLGAFESNLP